MPYNLRIKKRRKHVRVGPHYQAKIPNLQPVKRKVLYIFSTNNRVLTQWIPSDVITDDEIEEFVSLAKNNYNYSEEQALGLLMWHKHNKFKAVQDLPNFCPINEKWTTNDDACLKKSLKMIGDKNLLDISRMLSQYRWGNR